MADPVPKKDFFISYNKADRTWAEWIAWQLEEAGHTVTIQAWDFGPAGNLVIEMDRATKECGRSRAVVSPTYHTAFAEPFLRLEGRRKIDLSGQNRPTSFAAFANRGCEVLAWIRARGTYFLSS